MRLEAPLNSVNAYRKPLTIDGCEMGMVEVRGAVSFQGAVDSPRAKRRHFRWPTSRLRLLPSDRLSDVVRDRDVLLLPLPMVRRRETAKQKSVAVISLGSLRPPAADA